MERSAHLYRPPKFGVHFRPKGFRVVRCQDDGAAFGPVEDGIGAVRLYAYLGLSLFHDPLFAFLTV